MYWNLTYFVQALKGMQEIPTVGRHLLRAAFREHRSLMDAAVTRSDWNLAEEILLQVFPFYVLVSSLSVSEPQSHHQSVSMPHAKWPENSCHSCHFAMTPFLEVLKYPCNTD